MNRHDEQRDEGNSSCVCMLLRKLRLCATDMAKLENTAYVFLQICKENMEYSGIYGV